MEYLKLSNNTTYELVTNGVQEFGDTIKYVFLPEKSKTFEEMEAQFANKDNLEIVYVLDSDNAPMRSIVGYTKYKSMEKIKDYVISSEMVNQGTEDEPNYHEVENTATVMIVTMMKPDIEDKIAELEAKLEAFMQVSNVNLE